MALIRPDMTNNEWYYLTDVRPRYVRPRYLKAMEDLNKKADEEAIAKYQQLPLSDLRLLYDANEADLDPEQSDYFNRAYHLKLINEAIKRKERFKDLKEPPKEPDILDIIAQEEE